MNTRKHFLGLIVTAAITWSVSTGSGLAQQATPVSTKNSPDLGVSTTIEGLVRDVACPIQNHESTATDFNLKCALACARHGSPLIILTNTGDMYFPISDEMPDSSQRDKLMPFVGSYVRASGIVYTRNGTRTIVIKTIAPRNGIKLNTHLGDD